MYTRDLIQEKSTGVEQGKRTQAENMGHRKWKWVKNVDIEHVLEGRAQIHNTR